MMPRDPWEEEQAERQLAVIRERRQALEDFAAGCPALAENAPVEDRARIQLLASRLENLLRGFSMNELDEMEHLRREIEELSRRP